VAAEVDPAPRTHCVNESSCAVKARGRIDRANPPSVASVYSGWAEIVLGSGLKLS
jgi:hypothetical protein